jgi:ActR/RegA family two-component response regulator
MPNPSILIVDDEERFRTTLGKRLTERELDVTTVESGEEALKEIKRKGGKTLILVKDPGYGSSLLSPGF